MTAAGAARAINRVATPPTASITADSTIVVSQLRLDDAVVVQEALRWTSGVRAEPVELEQAAGCELAPFVEAAVGIGARVLATTADSSSVVTLSGTVAQLAERAEAASAGLIETAAQASERAVKASSAAAKETSELTAQVISNAVRRFEAESTQALDTKVHQVTQQLDALLAGEKSPIVHSIKDVFTRQMTDAHVAWHRSLSDTLSTVTRAFDPGNPDTPLAAHLARLASQQDSWRTELVTRLDKLQESVSATVNAATTAAAVAEVRLKSPAKGTTYEEAAGHIAEAIAAGMGASYIHTAETVGAVRNCRKGDGVFELAAMDPTAEVARVVLEFSTSGGGRNWPGYLREAERNRGAQGSLGVVPSRTLVPGGDILAILGPCRAVLAFDPESDDPSMLRAVLQLLAVQAQRRVAEARGGDLGVADQKIAEARQQLLAMQEVLKSALSVRAGASKVVTGLESLHASLAQLLEQAHAALRGASREGSAA